MTASLVRSLPRLLLGAVFLAAGILKGADPAEFSRQVESYGIVSGKGATLLAYGLIPLELVLAVMLLIGFRTRPAAAGASLLLVIFMGATAYAWSQGKTEGCGCFGSFASRTPAQVLWEDLGFLGLGLLTFALARREATATRWRAAIVVGGLVGALLLPFAAYTLPLDPLVTDLRLGQRVASLPLRESPVDLATGDHLVALLDLDDRASSRIVGRLNSLQGAGGAPAVVAFYGGEVDEKAVFCFNYDPNFEVVAAPRNELKRLYRTLPRFFRVRDGRVVRIWDGDPPAAEDLN